MEQWLTVSEVAEAARVSKMTIYRMIHERTLPAIRIGHSFRVPLSALRELLDSESGADSHPTSGDTIDDTVDGA